MTTEYRVRLDRGACDGVFACLVRDDRFVEADDGLASMDASEVDAGVVDATGDVEVASFADDRLGDVRQAARACPVDAIEVVPESDGEDDAPGVAATEGGDA
ncbi:ferredoxin [Halorubellus sp. PRR65]|uniref:ferredoxin n=1 Tax=Halorubellus sp. PRR65 TaxID=3098148 RepID=UPI002B25B4C5|nr:ferredoxin [Halorubellus sp. PRR65]